MDGVIVVDKAGGMTSHDVVNRLRRIANTRKIGHLGTLDPMATGVLPLLIGRATRLAQFLAGGEKKYEGTIHFGWSTDTYDREGKPTSPEVRPTFTRQELEDGLEAFRGRFLQTPPAFSAKKIGGTPAYQLARRQVQVDLAPVEVEVTTLELIELAGGIARVRVDCSSGTYVRSIAHDLGRRLGCGAFLDALRRTASGEFTEQQARPLQELTELADAGNLEDALIPAAQLLPQFSSARVDAATVTQIRQGKSFRISPFLSRPASKYVKAINEEGELVAIGEARLPHLYHPFLVL